MTHQYKDDPAERRSSGHQTAGSESDSLGAGKRDADSPETPKHSTAAILLIDDDAEIGRALQPAVGDIGCTLVYEADSERGLERALGGEFSLVILDLTMPRLGGIEVCRRIRQHDSHIPILMLTSRAEDVDKVLGFECGADDYVTKPFSVAEVLARIRALLRRAARYPAPGAAAEPPAIIVIGDLEIEPGAFVLRQKGSPVDLTRTEFLLLFTLVSNPGRVFTRDELSEHALGYETSGDGRAIASHFSRLRSKIEGESGKQYIVTVRGVGYRAAHPEELLS